VFVREIGLGPEDLLRALLLLETERRVHILDSGGARPPDARFLIAGFDPFETIEARGEQLRITGRDAAAEQVLRGDVLALLNERLRSYSRPQTTTEAMLPACGACIATFSYDLQASLFDRPRHTRAPSTTFEPDATLAFFDTLVIHDYARGASYLVTRAGPKALEQTFDALMDAASSRATRQSDPDALSPGPSVGDGQVVSNFTREEYLAAVELIKERIAAGDIYQANITQQLSVPMDTELTPETIFLRLRQEHPASFAAFIRRAEDVVVSASPERFLRVGAEDGGSRYVEAWPIKGTRARGANVAEDERLRRELQESDKDRAENVMIVDLLRNDLGRVCLYGSVHVPELCAIQEHPTLFHLVSKVRGRLRDDVEAGDLLRAAFPCGSITGAPKRRAMEIIAEVETAPRGLSMGALGYFSFDGRMDLSVAIRTMVLGPTWARFNVGGGIVADSDPALEYEESLLKARALLRALR
jgi:para-aminobenzoate synthetase component I